MKCIEAKKISKNYNGRRVLSDFSIGIEKNKITGIVGPNGSGKTTLINILSGSLKPDFGMVYINNEKIKKFSLLNLKKYRIARSFQETRIINQLSVKENISLGINENNVWKSFLKLEQSRNAKVEKILEKFGLTEKINELGQNLSLGQKKLIEISRVVISDADIIILDEPFSALDKNRIEVLKNLILGLKEQGKTIIFIEHNTNIIKSICDHTVNL